LGEIIVKKHPQWIKRFESLCKSVARKPFSWATHNCCSFAAECFEATTGVEDTGDFFPKNGYKNKREAYTAMVKMYDKGGMATIMEAAAEKYGMKEIPPLMAQRGDPVLAEFEGDNILATVDLSGQSIIAITPSDGLRHISISNVKRAWRVS
jgi:hypothetical protein